jgi:hypothetical protein
MNIEFRDEEENDVIGRCKCGEHKECVRKIHSNIEGRLWVENNEHFKCGKVQKQVNNMLEWWNKNYR